MQKLGTLHQFAAERAEQLDEEPNTPNLAKSMNLGDVIEIRPIPAELPFKPARLKAKPAELTE